MFRIIQVLAILLLASVASSAQSFQIEAGPSISKAHLNLSGNDDNSIFKWALGYHVGMTKSFTIKNNISIETGITLLSKEERYTIQYTDADGMSLGEGLTKVRFTLVQLPIKFKAPISEKFYIEAGPTLDYGLSANAAQNVPLSEPSSQRIDWDGIPYKRFTMGAQLEVGYRLSKFDIGMKYNYGIPYVIASGGSGSNGDLRFSLNVISLNLAYDINL